MNTARTTLPDELARRVGWEPMPGELPPPLTQMQSGAWVLGYGDGSVLHEFTTPDCGDTVVPGRYTDIPSTDDPIAALRAALEAMEEVKDG